MADSITERLGYLFRRNKEIKSQAVPQEGVANPSRRKFLAAALGVAGGAVVAANADWERIASALEAFGRTAEQSEAIDQFNKTLSEERLRNLEVGPNGAKLRVRPTSFSPDPEFNRIVGELKSGEAVPQAIMVKGNDPTKHDDLSKNGDWLFIPTKYKEDKATSGAFSYSGNFENNKVANQPVNP